MTSSLTYIFIDCHIFDVHSESDNEPAEQRTSNRIEELATTLIEVADQNNDYREIVHDMRRTLLLEDIYVKSLTILCEQRTSLLGFIIENISKRQLNKIFQNYEAVYGSQSMHPELLPLPTESEIEEKLLEETSSMPGHYHASGRKVSLPTSTKFYRCLTIACKHNLHAQCKKRIIVEEMGAGISCTCACH